MVQAPTGSGKTLAFVIPILEILRRREERWKSWQVRLVITWISLTSLQGSSFQVGGLILAPNRELAFQIASTVKAFLDNGVGDFKLITFVGGTKLDADVDNFKRNG